MSGKNQILFDLFRARESFGLTQRATAREAMRVREAFDFNVDQFIYYGGYPGGAMYINDERRWHRYIKDSIVAPAIEKDVLRTKVIYKPALMKQLFELGCAYSSEELSLNKIIGQLQDAGNVTTLAGYLTTLDESRLLCGLINKLKDSTKRTGSTYLTSDITYTPTAP